MGPLGQIGTLLGLPLALACMAAHLIRPPPVAGADAAIVAAK